MKGSTIKARKQFAAEVAAQDALKLPLSDRPATYTMRRWWLDRYTLEEIRELGHWLVSDSPVR